MVETRCRQPLAVTATSSGIPGSRRECSRLMATVIKFALGFRAVVTVKGSSGAAKPSHDERNNLNHKHEAYST